MTQKKMEEKTNKFNKVLVEIPEEAITLIVKEIYIISKKEPTKMDIEIYVYNAILNSIFK